VSREEPDTFWYQPTLDVFLNRWFSNYEQARESLETEGGFLLPYCQHFFVCEAEAVRALGLEPDDPDWEEVGWDCAKPADESAYRRLREKRERAARASDG
jgi:hypothetical protein